MALDVHSLIASLKRHRHYADQIVHTEVVPGSSACFADIDPPLPDRLAAALSRQGIDRLWSHQAAALDLARSGFPFVVTTPTASGKSLCYLAPILEMLLVDRQARALVVYPTKALAQDQAGKLRDLGLFPDVVHALYDGDTPRTERSSIRRTARLVLTNPDMLHVGILPGHSQ
ncbi:MAG: DEAD/DEAH box helicase, partial [Armatimonadaceae bacterium]